MGPRSHIFYDKFNTLKIVAFVARIDKSKALKFQHNDQGELLACTDTVSPYFISPETQAKPLIRSLSEHEADSYGYIMPH